LALLLVFCVMQLLLAVVTWNSLGVLLLDLVTRYDAPKGLPDESPFAKYPIRPLAVIQTKRENRRLKLKQTRLSRIGVPFEN
jgi:hypothetical protein